MTTFISTRRDEERELVIKGFICKGFICILCDAHSIEKKEPTHLPDKQELIQLWVDPTTYANNLAAFAWLWLRVLFQINKDFDYDLANHEQSSSSQICSFCYISQFLTSWLYFLIPHRQTI